MPKDYKIDYQRETSEHKATKAHLEDLLKGNTARDAELADLRRHRDAGKFATAAGEILTKFATAAVESVKNATKAAVKDMTTLKEGSLDGLAAAASTEIVVLRLQVAGLTAKLDASEKDRGDLAISLDAAEKEIRCLKSDQT